MNSPFVAVFLMLAQATPNALPSTVPAPPSPGLEQMLVASAIIFIVALGMQILANWAVSKMLVSGENDFAKAVKLFTMTLAGVIGAVVVAGVIIFVGNAAGISKAWIVAVVVFILLILYVIFATPMSVYRIGFLRSFSFILLTSIIAPIGQFAVITLLQILLNGTGLAVALHTATTPDPTKQTASTAAILHRFAPSLETSLSLDASTIAADRTKPVAVRRAALQRLRAELEARRVALDPKNKSATEDYKRDAQHYTQLYRELEALPPH